MGPYQEFERLARQATTNSEALRNAIAAAEACFQAVDHASSPAEKARLTRKLKELLAYAEQLKKGPSPQTCPVAPGQSRRLPTSEKTIILRSSRLHGHVFPPWEAPPSANNFRLADDGTLYQDESEFCLSPRQQDIFAGWKRPSEMFSLPTRAGDGGNNAAHKLPSTLMQRATTENDLVQDITTDCSVVASLCAAMKHLSCREKPLLADLMYPFDATSSTPLMSENGKYVFKMNFNGCFRHVSIDDRLPASRTSRTLFVVDRKNPQLIWPALMEKAYLKIRGGGYDFPGSNSGTDLWVLTGWIPEQIFLHEDTEPDQSWARIKDGYDRGEVVVTLGTGRLSHEEEEALGLAGEHDYAVMDVRVENGVRRMLVKNPWCDGLIWKGVGSSAVLEPKTTPNSPAGNSPASLTDGMTGTFWISFEDIVQNFESLYLNWNPSLFSHRQDHHFTWDIPDPMLANSFARNPQYSICAQADGTVWALLDRHFHDEELTITRNRLSTSSARRSTSLPDSLGFMSLFLFSNTGGSRIQLPDRPRWLQKQPFVDSPQTLLRFRARRGERYTLAVAQSSLPLPKYNFSLSFFSRSPLEVSKADPEHAHYTTITGSWTRRSAGGNGAEPTYLSNPQYSIKVTTPTAISLLLCTDNQDLPLHVDLLWSGTGVAASGNAREIVASSGEYRRGSALCAVSRSCPASTAAGGASVLQPGMYIAVLSTFEPGQLASYTLEIGSSAPDGPVVVAPAARTGAAAGRLRTALPPVPQLPPSRYPPTTAHDDQDSSDARGHRAPVIVSRLTRLSVAVAPRSGGVHAVRVRLEAGTNAHRRELAFSGGDTHEFVDAARGARTLEVDVDPGLAQREGGLWVVIEQMGGGNGNGAAAAYVAAPTVVEVFSDNPVQLGPWEYNEH
ncbi:uncharacterized protein PgNI_09910 [Pyricularia grisea]|uniref:Calpain catalytic domain-containing protein n=1 Tax=Pyricularia grisea TaxID=148305 RepID=A0A6P8ASN0_PYRGI|nr:uncharacterized protein PgNI_09910 [Pyricularia grisea]TLD05131.1 hypothetical protein PgNI_09910 [Pyricularia grisea]